MSGGPRPPRVTGAFAGICFPQADRPAALGDLAERHARLSRVHGRRAADRWYRRQCLQIVIRLPASRLLAAGRRALAGAHRAWTQGGAFSDASRSLRRAPRFTLPAVTVFAVTITANTLVFSVVDAVLLEPLPYPEAEDLAVIWETAGSDAGRKGPVSYTRFRYFAGMEDLFEVVGAFETAPTVLHTEAASERLHGAATSAGVWAALRVPPLHGRSIRPEDDVPGAPPVAVLSHRLWTSRFGADEAVVGRGIDLDGRLTRVIGVMPRGFWFHDPYMFARSSGARENALYDLWTPLENGRDWSDDGWSDYPALRVVARLHPGVAPETAADLLVARDPAAPSTRYPEVVPALRPLFDEIAGANRRELVVSLATSLLVLLIACANIGGLISVRAVARRGDLAARLALGASPGHVYRILVAECLLLALVGCAVGLALARGALPWAVAATPRDLPLITRIDVDARVATFTLLTGLIAGLLASVPALAQHRRAAVTPRPSARTSERDPAARRYRSLLVAAQVAVTLFLLVPTTALVRDFARLATADPGFTARGVTTFKVLPASGWELESGQAFHRRLTERLRGTHGIESVGGASAMPFGEWQTPGAVWAPGSADEPVRVLRQNTLPGYVETLRIPVLQGRTFRESDTAGGEPVVMLGRSLAERLGVGAGSGRVVIGAWGVGGSDIEARVVGVLQDVRQSSTDEPAPPTLYVPQAQTTNAVMQYVVRSDLPSEELRSRIVAAGAEVDPRQPLDRFDQLDFLVRQSYHREASIARVLGALGAMALLLALVGIYGTVSYTARSSLFELGMRKAFGAAEPALVALMVHKSVRPLVAGLAAGSAGAFSLHALVETVVGDVPPADGPSMAIALTVLLATGLVATFLPVRWAASVDPVRVLRDP